MRRLDPMAVATAAVVVDAAATGLAVLIAADVAEIAADAVVSRVAIAVDVEATVAHVKAAVAADLAGESVVPTANADQAHHLGRFRT
jgi:hypothetical protein